MHARKSGPRSPMHLDPRVSSPTQALAASLAKLLPRRTYTPSKVRNFAILALLGVSLLATTLVVYTWVTSPVAAPTHARPHQYNLQVARRDEHDRPASRSFRYRSDGHQRPLSPNGPAWSFSQHPDMELGALIGFLSALASNSLPLTIDPSEHIDPELVLGFNSHAGDDKVQFEVETMVADTWTSNPIVIFSELHSPLAPASREAKALIAEYRLFPEPTIFEVDQRVDAVVLKPLLRRLTGSDRLPLAIIGGKIFGSLEAIRDARDDGSLTLAMSHSSATIDGALVHKKKHH